MSVKIERVIPAVVIAIAAAAPSLAAAQSPPNCAAASAPHPGYSIIDCDTLAAIDAAATQMIATGESAGLAIAILRDGAVLFKSGFGKADLENDAPVTPDTVFSIFSMAKSFTAAAVMKLVEQGKLSLDDPLSKFYPDFPRAEEVTIRQILSHTSGIHNFAEDGVEVAEANLADRSIDEQIAYLASMETAYDFGPGTKFWYSNSNYTIAGGIIQKASGKPYREFMRESIFQPAGLDDTAIDHIEDVVQGRAEGYVVPERNSGDFVHGPLNDPSVPGPAGGMRSSLEDQIAWWNAFFDGRVVTPESVQTMIAPARVRSGKLAGDVIRQLPDQEAEPGSFGYFGLGLMSSGPNRRIRTLGSGGNFPSFSSSMVRYLDHGFMTIVLANTGPRAAQEMEWRIADIILSKPRAQAAVADE